ncbi:uncharacterized protein LOC130685345 [Daphnia carinata]|uniref:uncharacterized protein LOC130685345 n=1 Tax=Daphnia carinata TaxID=120202 RepID=UPI0025799FBF|nr:uncharacterized protein LOC130685345 [Daphnia carinata]
MDKENRTNSILKPTTNPSNQLPGFEYEEEQTENFTFSRRKSFKKRVSFAGRDEIKEFQKHEVLTVQKLEKVLNQLQDETEFLKMNELGGWDSEKENIDQQTLVLREISVAHDYMEITSLATIECDTIKSIAQEIESREMSSGYDCMDITTIASDESNKNETTVQEVEMEVCSDSVVQISGVITVKNHTATEEFTLPCIQPILIENNFCCGKNSMEISVPEVEIPIVQENTIPSCMPKEVTVKQSSKECHEMIMEDVNTNCSSELLKPTLNEAGVIISEMVQPDSCMLQKFSSIQEPVQEVKSLCSDDSNEFLLLAKQFNWEVLFFDSLLVFSKIHDYLTLKLKLDAEYTYQNVKHYVVEDIEIDTRKDVEQKWTRFGLMILETSLENSNLREVCSNTQDLPKLMYVVEEHTRMFVDFATEDSLKFELLANQRSIRFHAGYSDFNVTFESSNLENLSWVRISLNLFPRLPLSAKDISVESILGIVNKAEITNMISNIRPSTLYLTRIAECVEDFLKFRSVDNERKMLNCAKH